jgi:hypothetical protein
MFLTASIRPREDNNTHTLILLRSFVQKKEAKKKAANLLRKTLVVKLNADLQSPSPWTPVMISDAKAKIKALQDAGKKKL